MNMEAFLPPRVCLNFFLQCFKSFIVEIFYIFYLLNLFVKFFETITNEIISLFLS